MGFGGTSTKGRRFPAEVLTVDEVRALMNAARHGIYGARDRALIATLYRGGLRISEALDLFPKDLDVATGVLRVLDGKGHKPRTLALDTETVALVELWLEIRRQHGLNGVHPLFCTLEGRAMARPNVTALLKRLGKQAGIEKRVHPHGLRHSRAVDLVHRGTNLPTIQAVLGHTSLATTQTYVNHLENGAVIAAMRDDGGWIQ